MINTPIRLSVLIILAFCLALVLSLVGLVQQGRKDVVREAAASQMFTLQLVNAARYSVTQLKPLFDNEQRHIEIALQPFSEPVSGSDEVPDWFMRLVYSPEQARDSEQRVLLADGEYMYLRASPEDEIEEIWESALVLMAVFAGAALLSVVALYWGMRYQLRPILALVQKSARPEVLDQSGHCADTNQIARHFERMLDDLSREQQGNHRLTREIMQLQEQERTRLAHSLHDDLGQYLTGIQAQAYMIKQLASQPEPVADSAQRILDHCNDMQQNFRVLIRDLHPVILDQLGLNQAITTLVEQWQASHGVEVELDLTRQLPELNAERASHLYRLIQEALHNIARHAAASKVYLRLSCQGCSVTLRVEDNGIGFSADSVPGIGMRSMNERARYLGGKLRLDPLRNGGTRLGLDFPLELA